MLIGVLMYNRKQQRLMVDGLIALLLVGVLTSVVMHRREQSRRSEEYTQVHEVLAQMHEQAVYRGVLQVGEDGIAGFPKDISPLWFPDGLPVNQLVPGSQPWVDVAPENDENDHPPDPIITSPTQAGIWYNPNRGVFRARVTPQWSDSATLELYNVVNETNLEMLVESKDPSRQPVPILPTLDELADRTKEQTPQDSTPTDQAVTDQTMVEVDQEEKEEPVPYQTPGGRATLLNAAEMP